MSSVVFADFVRRVRSIFYRVPPPRTIFFFNHRVVMATRCPNLEPRLIEGRSGVPDVRETRSDAELHGMSSADEFPAYRIRLNK